MNLNNKGFAISGILYSLLILFVSLFLGMLTIFASSKFSFDKIKKDIINKLSAKVINSNISSNNSCIRNVDLLCDNGTVVKVQVNENTSYDFYVIADTGNELTLIMDRNLGENVIGITQEDYNGAGGSSWVSADLGSNSEGPLTALITLENRTANWNNISPNTYILENDDDGNEGVNTYEPIIRTNVRARMLTYTESINLGCTNGNNNCPDYLTSNLSAENTNQMPLGYWLSTVSSSMYYDGYGIECGSGLINTGIVEESSYGIRPVIKLSKME